MRLTASNKTHNNKKTFNDFAQGLSFKFTMISCGLLLPFNSFSAELKIEIAKPSFSSSL